MKTQIEKSDSPAAAIDSSPHHFKDDSVGYISISPSLGFEGHTPADSPSGSASHLGENNCGHISLAGSPAPSSDSAPVGNYDDSRLSPSPAAVVVFSADESGNPKAVVPQTGDRGNGSRRFKPGFPPILSSGERGEIYKKAALGFRISGFVFSLVSFSVLAADRYKGWALDSFNRYIEFRYCLSMNVIGVLYSGAQAFDLSYHLVIAYLLISASSSAAIRVEDWELNWGKDKFTEMATAAVTLSFLAFVAVACNSLISGYALCTSSL
ncbi:hypothetical protein M569_16652 [Genlisea aurea]|uniref:CASP-like protein n=1 Tax=Genlisea aurea TaxID=192259 RepID=S8BU82_9LAMI|nr:hypothetical protein M569_16652 [Genlisea aurea]